MYLNPVITILHNLKEQRYHPIVFIEYPLPGPPSPDKPVRHKSKGHHTTGFATRDEAVAYASGELLKLVKEYSVGKPKLCLQKDFPWDGEDVPAMVTYFGEVDGETKPLLG